MSYRVGHTPVKIKNKSFMILAGLGIHVKLNDYASFNHTILPGNNSIFSKSGLQVRSKNQRLDNLQRKKIADTVHDFVLYKHFFCPRGVITEMVL
jgi:hypothetical protein